MNSEPSYKIISFPSAQIPEDYIGFVYSKWLRSLKHGNPLFKKIDNGEYYKKYHIYIGKLLEKPDSIARFAVLSDDEDIALGFSITREDLLDYIYVTADYRKHGIGTRLMPEGITTFGHITLTALNIWQKKEKYRYLKFNPFA